MGDILAMSFKERRFLIELNRVKEGQQTLVEASERLDVSYRHIRRINQRFKEEGEKGLTHRNRGRKSNRSFPETFREKCLELYALRMSGFGPTFAAEKLKELGKTINPETLRMWLKGAGLWERQRKHGPHRNWRAPKKHFGEMVQMDGSFHDWFEEGKSSCLMNMVDDATGVTYAGFYSGETTAAAMQMLWDWIELYGIPRSLYTDRKNVYVTDREPSVAEELSGEMPLTAFGKACQKLGIRIIEAHSPQAKGRVERKNGVLQDRLIKDMAYNGIKGVEAGNSWLRSNFLPGLNKKFSRKPLSPTDYHQPVSVGIKLEEIFVWETQREVQGDWTIRWENRWFQLERGSGFLPATKKKVMVQVRLDGTLKIIYRGNPLNYREIAKVERRQITKDSKTPISPKGNIPSTNHPWRRAFPLSAKGRNFISRESSKEIKVQQGEETGDSVPEPLGFTALG